MSKDMDIITFFAAFERYLLLSEVPSENWAKLLVSCLNEKASALYTTLSLSDCADYQVMKKFLINEFRANPSVYRARMLSLHRSGSDSYEVFLTKLNDVFSHYLQSKNIVSFESLRDDV
jgi:hypothetical protein